jgi:Ni/Fe-hydrogenase 1 B-type cytochrome subunit
MAREILKRVPVWSGLLRLCHWAMALLLGALFLTALLARYTPELSGAARDYHFMAGHVLLLAFALRVYLLFFGDRADRLAALLPGRLELSGAAAMVRFYLSFGRTPLPNWYAHNPLWMPLYLLFYAVLLLALTTGLDHDAGMVFAPDTGPALHAFASRFLLWFAVLHTAAAFWHDYKGTGSDVSAMISGRRIFVVENPTAAVMTDTLKH